MYIILIILILTYGLKVCALSIRVLQSLNFTINRVLIKPFKSSNTAVIEQCRYFFRIELHPYSSRDVLRNFWQILLMIIMFFSRLIITNISVITVFFLFLFVLCHSSE